ncbi:MAG: 50S ribosomal protein L11 methyltransferase [bacterium]|nr:50S ribosomal protein L11 methyltransferase [bacterium]
MVIGHKVIIEDKVRCEAYQKAIRQVVKNGNIVADIGTGSGLLAYFAIQAGAGKVYAVEKSEIIEDAKRIAIANGWDDKIVFIKGVSTEVELPEKVDVIVLEVIGYFALEENLLKYISDAKKRFLKRVEF